VVATQSEELLFLAFSDGHNHVLIRTPVGIISATAEWNDCVSFRILQEYDNLRNGMADALSLAGTEH